MKQIATIVEEMLSERGQDSSISHDEPLFTSGRLDSLAATELMVCLESDFGIDLASADFDISALDTLTDLEALVSQKAA